MSLREIVRKITKLFNFSFMALSYGWGSAASRLEQLREGCLLFTNKFPKVPSTHFRNLGKMKG